MPGSFSDVLSEAINEFIEQGYESPDELRHWVAMLHHAAEVKTPSDKDALAMFRRAFTRIKERLVDRGKVAEYVPCVKRFTLSSIAPDLRAELDRRILASSDLIKMNRKKAIETTLSRFSGWATSIPRGGLGVIDKRAVRKHIAKPIAQVKYEERRVSIDQGHKLLSNIAYMTAKANGAIAMEWHSRWRVPGYDFREEHKERDGIVYAIRDSWAAEEGLIKRGDHPWLEDITQPAQEVFCMCTGKYMNTLQSLPDEMLTAKGRAAVSEMKAA